MRNRGSASVSVSLKTMDLGYYLALVRFDQQQKHSLTSCPRIWRLNQLDWIF